MGLGVSLFLSFCQVCWSNINQSRGNAGRLCQRHIRFALEPRRDICKLCPAQVSMAKVAIVRHFPNSWRHVRRSHHLRKLQIRHRHLRRGTRDQNGPGILRNSVRGYILHVPRGVYDPHRPILLRVPRQRSSHVHDLCLNGQGQHGRRPVPASCHVLHPFWTRSLFRMGDWIRHQSRARLWAPSGFVHARVRSRGVDSR